jgi:hypothetical protein
MTCFQTGNGKRDVTSSQDVTTLLKVIEVPFAGASIVQRIS